MTAKDYLEKSDFKGLQSFRYNQIVSVLQKDKKGMLTQDERQESLQQIVLQESMEIWKYLEKHEEKWQGGELPNLLNKLLVPLHLKDQVDSAIPNPHLSHAHTWSDCVAFSLRFDCVDDGGLLQAHNPVGQTFQLKRSDGVTATLEIVAKFEKGDPNAEDVFGHKETCRDCDVYRCIGNIENFYFANYDPPRPNIEIFVKNQEICYLLIYAFPHADRTVYSIDFDRWQPYIAARKEMDRTILAEMEEIVNRVEREERYKMPVRKIKPYIFLVESSAAMSGEPIQAVKEGIKQALESLKEREEKGLADMDCHVAIMEFAASASWLTNGLEPVMDLRWYEDCHTLGRANYGRMLDFLNEGLNRNVLFQNCMVGVYKPTICIICEGSSSDDYKTPLERLRMNRWFQAADLHVIGLLDPDMEMVREIVGENGVYHDGGNLKEVPDIFKKIVLTSC